MTSSIGRDHARYSGSPSPSDSSPIVVERWVTEQPLFVLAALVATALWVVIVFTVVPLVYAVFLGLFFGLMRLGFMAHIRGSAVRLGPNQFPELHETVARLARRMGIDDVPAAYLMQAGGSLNAFATRFFGANIIVLYSDLLEACGDNTAARDMIIAHELGHIKAGHVRWHLFLMPAAIVPFLLTALSRAREYTCDRYGVAGAGSVDGAGLGLAILAAGAKHGPLVNRAELVRQRGDVESSGLMTVGAWLGTHPPLSNRLAAIDPSLGASAPMSRKGAVRAGLVAIVVPIVLLSAGISIATSKFVQQIRSIGDSTRVAQSRAATARRTEEPAYTPPADAPERARADILRIAKFIDANRRDHGLPWNTTDLYHRLAAGETWEPVDPFDDTHYAYQARGEDFIVYSSGPDGESWTADDIRYDSRVGGIVPAMSSRSTSPPRSR
jgi:Zn-dependent protease with chaperone function